MTEDYTHAARLSLHRADSANLHEALMANSTIPTQAKAFHIIDRTPELIGPWIDKQGGGHWRSGNACIGLAHHGEIVAGTMYENYNGRSVVASIAIHGPISRRWLWYIFYYPFVQLNCSVILAFVSISNTKCLHMMDRMGFVMVGAIPEADPSGVLGIFAMHKKDCRYLRSRYGKI